MICVRDDFEYEALYNSLFLCDGVTGETGLKEMKYTARVSGSKSEFQNSFYWGTFPLVASRPPQITSPLDGYDIIAQAILSLVLKEVTGR